MDEDALRARLIFLEEIVCGLYRDGIVTDEMLGDVAERLAARASNHGPSEAGVLEHAAHLANMIPFEATVQVETASERRAEFLRAQIRERTAMIVHNGNSDA